MVQQMRKGEINMILTNELNTVYSINEAWLRRALRRETSLINEHADTHMEVEVYNNRPNRFIIVVDCALEYILATTEYTAELTDPAAGDTLLAAVVDDSDNFEDKLAIHVISAVYKTL